MAMMDNAGKLPEIITITDLLRNAFLALEI
jgi:hypothetical protein